MTDNWADKSMQLHEKPIIIIETTHLDKLTNYNKILNWSIWLTLNKQRAGNDFCFARWKESFNLLGKKLKTAKSAGILEEQSKSLTLKGVKIQKYEKSKH